ncbi:cuticle protein 16.8-like [Amblyomma americanum]
MHCFPRTSPKLFERTMSNGRHIKRAVARRLQESVLILVRLQEDSGVTQVMFEKVWLLACFAVYAAGQDVVQTADPPPQPYSFRYDTTDEFGTRTTREETSDEYNTKVGSYSYTDPTGLTRTVRYVADADGFRATVETNEPGTRTSNPADVQITSAYVEPPPSAFQATRVALQSAPAVVAVHAAPAGEQHHAEPVAVHGAVPVALHAAPVSFATAQHAVPVTVTPAPAAGKAKSRR